MASRLGLLAAAASAQPEADAWTLPLATPAEEAALLRFNDTAVPLEPGCLHELVLAQAERTPRAPAVSCGETTLAYAELLDRARRLAGELSASGAAPESIVSLLLGA